VNHGQGELAGGADQNLEQRRIDGHACTIGQPLVRCETIT
jgi:hypothetical protein